ncbi:MAG: transglutaminaseTgpA domain-containing protein, partial [Dehalococcoidia bacterium]|nr:transglutaminaseTgpA domain-containing protein [Dehalococcoidia bacterium]
MVRFRFPSSDPVALALAAVVLGSALLSLEMAGWVEDLPRLTLNGLVAMLLAWALLASGIPRYLAHLAALPAGILAILWQIMPIVVGTNWLEKTVDMYTRLNAWGYAARTGGINTDPLAFFLLLLTFAWLGGYALSWSTARGRRPWWAIVSCGVVLLLNLNYAPPRLGAFFLAYTLASLLLIVRLNQSQPLVAKGLKHEGRLFFYSTALAVSLSLATWFAPTPGESPDLLNIWYRVNTPWQDGLGQANRLFAFLVSKERPGPGDFDKALVLRGTSNLSDEPVMLVESPMPRYWRGLSYDYYTGLGWLSQEQTQFRAPSSPVDPQVLEGQYQNTKEVTQTITILSPKNNLVFAAGQAQKVLDLGVGLETSRRNPTDISIDALANPTSLPRDLRPYANVLQRALRQVNARWDDSRLLPAINRQLPEEVRVTGVIKSADGRLSGLRAVTRYPADITALYASS